MFPLRRVVLEDLDLTTYPYTNPHRTEYEIRTAKNGFFEPCA